MKARPYATTARLAWLQERLGPRDLAILQTLALVRVATGRQLERVHFAGLTPLSAARVRRRTLERLHELGLVVRLDRRIGGVRAGSAGFVYALDVAGQRLVSRCGPAGGHTLRRPWTPSLAFLKHLLLVSELYVQTVELTREGHLELVRFETEPTCWRRFSGPGGGVLILKPDALVVLATDEYEDRYFMEADRSTESPRALSRKVELYRQYWASGREQARHDIFPRVLFLVPDEARKAVVVDVFGRQPADSWQLYQVALFDELRRVFCEGAPE